MKFKSQLQMHERLNSVINLVEESLKDANFFLIYFVLLTVFFAVLALVEGSVIPDDDYEDLDVYTYYIIQGLRNSVGDL